MFEVRQTLQFQEWFEKLKDKRAIEKITQRLVRLQSGLLGDVKPVGEGISELRIHYGPGYRVYFVKRGHYLIVLLCAGDKNSQHRDIQSAKDLAKDLEV